MKIKRETVIAKTLEEGTQMLHEMRRKRRSEYWLDAEEYEGATLVLDFKNWLFAICEYPGGPLVEKQFSDIMATTRTGTAATDWDNQGNLVQYAANATRRGWNSTTLASLGLMGEEGTTNLIRNNTMQGAGAGVPPTNWSGVAANGITCSFVGKTTSKGFTYVDVDVTGTATIADGFGLFFETITAIAGVNGETFTNSAYIALVSGTTNNVNTISLRQSLYSSASALLGNVTGPNIKTDLTGTLKRFISTGTVNNASTAYTRPYLEINWGAGAVINMRLRIALPQCEKKAYATSVVLTTGTAQTRGDEATSTTNMLWFDKNGGIFVCEYEQPTNGAMVMALDTAGNQPRMHASVTSPSFTIYGVNGAGQSINATYAHTDVAGSINRLLYAYTTRSATNDGTSLTLAKNGAVLGNTLATMDLGTFTPTRLTLAYRVLGSAQGWLNSHLGKVVFYPNHTQGHPTDGRLIKLSTVAA